MIVSDFGAIDRRYGPSRSGLYRRGPYGRLRGYGETPAEALQMVLGGGPGTVVQDDQGQCWGYMPGGSFPSIVPCDQAAVAAAAKAAAAQNASGGGGGGSVTSTLLSTGTNLVGTAAGAAGGAAGKAMFGPPGTAGAGGKAAAAKKSKMPLILGGLAAAGILGVVVWKRKHRK